MSSYHQLIDDRIFRLVEAAVEKIDANPVLRGQLRENVGRWTNESQRKAWRDYLQRPWTELRGLLLARSEEGARLRQDAPLGGILNPAERRRIFREFAHDPRAA
jgi:hypothetical protein